MPGIKDGLPALIRTTVRILPLLITVAVGHPAWAGTDSEKMAEELRRLLDQGRQTKAARPEFLDKMKKILDSGLSQVGPILLTESFRDGDYDRNPNWTVLAGHFSVDSSGSLFSSEARTETLSMQAGGELSDLNERPTEKKSEMKMVQGIVGLVTGSSLKNLEGGDALSKSGVSRPGKNTAAIYTKVVIPNAFRLQFTFRSDLGQGEGDVGVIFNKEILSGYHLRCHADRGRNKTLEILRYNEYKRPETVALLPGNGLGDGLNHHLTWKRSPDGTMTVGLDGHVVLQTHDQAISRGFDGLVLVNHQGDIAYGGIEMAEIK
ncbi:MAG: hypothetical protein HQL73_11375 [Magnetococcales bacterium]|nr:hypothetical protein [Magnetococcales bacterium]